MPDRPPHWLTAQQVAVEMNTTSAEVCRLVNIGRLVGKKHKQPGRPGVAQWIINPTSVTREMRRMAKLAAESARRRAERDGKAAKAAKTR